MNVTNHLNPFILGVGQGPHTSECTRAKGSELRSPILLYVERVCFASSHASHTSLFLSTLFSISGYNLFIPSKDICPSRQCCSMTSSSCLLISAAANTVTFLSKYHSPLRLFPVPIILPVPFS